jgi:hypothetical protein
MITQTCTEVAATAAAPSGPVGMGKPEAGWRHSGDTESHGDTRRHGRYAGRCVNTGDNLAAPQGFEPRYADPESAVLPLNEGAV